MAIVEANEPHAELMRKAGQILLYVNEYKDHPQAESLNFPNRVAIDEGYYAGIKVEREVQVVCIWETIDPEVDPIIRVSRMSLIAATGPVGTPYQGLLVEEMDFLITKFQTLLNVSFFKG